MSASGPSGPLDKGCIDCIQILQKGRSVFWQSYGPFITSEDIANLVVVYSLFVFAPIMWEVLCWSSIVKYKSF